VQRRQREPARETIPKAHPGRSQGTGRSHALWKMDISRRELLTAPFNCCLRSFVAAVLAPDSFRRRLLANELVVAIVHPKDDNTWLIQEMAGADFLGKPLIPLLEEGASLKSGIHGDLEYIKFTEGEISQTFTPLLEGLREIGYSFSG
jgi:hypothetical protein